MSQKSSVNFYIARLLRTLTLQAQNQVTYVPILSDTAAHPSLPARFPAAMDIRYAEANEVVTEKGVSLIDHYV